MNKKILVVIAFCLIATLLIQPVFAPGANNVLEIVKDIQTTVSTIVSDLANLYQKLWSDTDSVKNDTERITTTQANLSDWKLPAYTTAGIYNIVSVYVGDFYGDGVAQFTVTAKSEYLDGILEVYVDVSGDASADMPAMMLEATVDKNYGTTTFVGSWFSIRLNLKDTSPSFEKQIEWAYMVVAPPGAKITEVVSPPPPPAPTPPPPP